MTKKNQNNKFSLRAKWSLFLIANLAILLVIGISTVRESYRAWTIDMEIGTLKNQINSLQNQKTELRKLTKKIKDNQYLEKQARAKLNLQKPSEHVIVLEGINMASTSWVVNIDKHSTKNNNNIALSNPKKWWLYFSQGKEALNKNN